MRDESRCGAFMSSLIESFSAFAADAVAGVPLASAAGLVSVTTFPVFDDVSASWIKIRLSPTFRLS